MADRSPIEWTDATWNPLAAFDRETGKRGWFCTKVSDGCTNCYAETLNRRLGTGHLYRAGNLEKIEFRLVNLDQPMRWKRPRRVFVNSMTDLFHETVPDELIDQVFAAMALAPQHMFQVLTKRAERMAEYLTEPCVVRRICEAAYALHRSSCKLTYPEFSSANTRRFNAHMKRWWDHVGRLTAWTVKGGISADMFERNEPGREYPSYLPWPLSNVWLGTSVEHQQAADERIPHLLRTPAAVRFLSCEPLLGPIDLERSLWSISRNHGARLNALHWVIVGGESGPKARPFGLTYARSLVEQCSAASVPVFVKQLGANPSSIQLKHPKGGNWSEWPEDLRVRDFPEVGE